MARARARTTRAGMGATPTMARESRLGLRHKGQDIELWGWCPKQQQLQMCTKRTTTKQKWHTGFWRSFHWCFHNARQEEERSTVMGDRGWCYDLSLSQWEFSFLFSLSNPSSIWHMFIQLDLLSNPFGFFQFRIYQTLTSRHSYLLTTGWGVTHYSLLLITLFLPVDSLHLLSDSIILDMYSCLLMMFLLVL